MTTSNGPNPPPRLLLWAAPDQAGESACRQQLAAWLAGLRDDDPLDDAHDAGWGPDHSAGPVRGAIVAATAAEAARQLTAARPAVAPPRPPRPVALLFPGQGAQFPRMAAGLYRQDPTFTAAMDAVFDGLGALGDDVRLDWFADLPSVPLDDVARAQPLLFAIDYAFGRLLTAAGVRPAALLGHSIGEFSASVLAGVFTVEQATAVLRDRIDRIGATPPGGMLAVAATPERLQGLLRDDVVVGAINAPGQTVLAGPEQPLAEIAAQLREMEIVCRYTKARQGFHSPMLAPACLASRDLLSRMTLHEPEITVHSGYTASRVSTRRALDPEFWLMQPALPVLFAPALDNLLTTDLLLVEAGPGQGLSALARRHPAVLSGRSAIVPMSPAGPADADTQWRCVLKAFGRIWTEGHPIELSAGLPVLPTAS